MPDLCHLRLQKSEKPMSAPHKSTSLKFSVTAAETIQDSRTEQCGQSEVLGQ